MKNGKMIIAIDDEATRAAVTLKELHAELGAAVGPSHTLADTLAALPSIAIAMKIEQAKKDRIGKDGLN